MRRDRIDEVVSLLETVPEVWVVVMVVLLWLGVMLSVEADLCNARRKRSLIAIFAGTDVVCMYVV